MKTVQSVAKKPNHGPGHIGPTQRAVIDDLMTGMYKYDVLRKHKVHPARYKRWLNNHIFRKVFDERIEAVRHQHRFVALHSLPIAVEKLAKLIASSQKDETVRKACLDIIALHKENAAEVAAQKTEESKHSKYPMSQAKAAKIWAIMAEPDEPDPVPAPEPVPDSTESPAASDEQPIPDRVPDRNYYAFLNRHPAPEPVPVFTQHPAPSTEYPVSNTAPEPVPDFTLHPAPSTEYLVNEPQATSHEQRALTPEQLAAEKRSIEAELSIQRHADNVRRMWRPARGH